MNWSWKRLLLVGALGLAAGGSVGCASERPPINQVQADALAKSFFVGANLQDAIDDPEFYFRTTVIDVGYGAAQDGLFTSTYAQPISRIRWEITEDYLNARLSYERIGNTDGKGNKVDGLSPKQTEDGQIVASFKISSHFDIKRAYNPSTGEEQNLIQENTTDRPWYQREYFRVDWSQNLMTDGYDFDTLSMMGLFGGIEYEPLAYTVLDPADPNAPHFDADAGYFDVTNKAFAKPALLDLSSLGWGINTFPACMLPGEFAGGTQPYGNCNPVEITLRMSFKRVMDTDYQPVDYDGYRFQAFGVFTTDRLNYDRNYGIVDGKWYRFASRYNIWERSHFYGKDPQGMTDPIACATQQSTELGANGGPYADPNRDADFNGTADECEAAGAGSQCDVFKQKCTLPYEKRKAVTIPWYINGTGIDPTTGLSAQDLANASPADVQAAEQKAEDLFEATNWAVQEWDVAMKTAIQSAKYGECVSTKAAHCADLASSVPGANCNQPVPAACHSLFPMWTGQQDDIDDAVAIARNLDVCHRTKGWTDKSCSALIDQGVSALQQERGANDVNGDAFSIGQVLKLDPVIVLCHNPVTSKDHPVCGAPGLAPRLGDIRYNTVLNIDKPQQPSAWGIMVDGDDPLTGEKVAASINIWTHVTDLASQSLVDLVKYMNGEISTADITNGTYINNWVKASKVGAGNTGPTMSKQQVRARLAAAAHVTTDQMAMVEKNHLATEIAGPMTRNLGPKIADVAASQDLVSSDAQKALAKMALARGTDVESQLLDTPAMLQLANDIDPTGNSDGSQMPKGGTANDVASGLAFNNPKVREMLSQMRENALAANGACVLDEAPEPSSLTAIADVMKQKFPVGAVETDPKSTPGQVQTAQLDRWTAMQRYIRRKYHYAVLAHEMGHSVGLRHNFVSSFAALHFRPQYWQLRTKNGKVDTMCTDAVDKTGAEACVGPRYFDPLTDDEQNQMIWMYMQSTVMDYPGDVSQDTIGLGVYDFAAARMFYGDVVSVYDVKSGTGSDPKYLASGNVGQGLYNTMDNFGGLGGIQYAIGAADSVGGEGCVSSATSGPCVVHYSHLQHYYNLISHCYPVTATQPSWWDASKDGNWSQSFDGHIVNVDGAATKCRALPVDYTFWSKMINPSATQDPYVAQFRGAAAVEPITNRVRVPYAFASDNWADIGNVSVFRHDNGADPYEQVNFLLSTQEDRHILDNYRRGRVSFSVRAAADRSFQRYNDKMYGISNGVGFISNIYKDFADGQGLNYNDLWPFIVNEQYHDNMLAASVAFDHFARELSRPETGDHYRMGLAFNDPTLRSASDPDGNPGTTLVTIPNGSTGYLKDVGFGGHPLENALCENCGDYDVDYTENAGSYYDKINAAILFSESEDRFISQSRQDFYDSRFRSVGMADIFPDGYRRIISNALTGDRSLLAAHVTATGGVPDTVGLAAADPRDPLSSKYPKNPMGWTSWWPTEGPAMCFPSNGSNICYGYTGSTGDFKPINPSATVNIDPQIGWEVQKFIIAWTVAYITADKQANWIDQLRIYMLGENSDPVFTDRIEFQDPISGKFYYAKNYGYECLFGQGTDRTSCTTTGGKWVQKGIAARVLEYANELVANGYELDTTTYPGDGNQVLPGYNAFGRAMFTYYPDGSTPHYKTDQALGGIDAMGGSAPPTDCDATVCNVHDNHYADQLNSYVEVPDYLWEVVIKYGLGDPNQLGLFP